MVLIGGLRKIRLTMGIPLQDYTRSESGIAQCERNPRKRTHHNMMYKKIEGKKK